VDFEKPSIWYLLEDVLVNHGIGRNTYKKLVADVGLRGDEKVLEIGCGTGPLSRHIAGRLSAGRGMLTCVDSSQILLGMARKRLRRFKNIEFKVGEIQNMDLPDNAYDIAFIHFMLHDVAPQQRQELIDTVAAKVKCGGRIVVKEPTNSRHGMPAERIRELLAAAGLQEVSSIERSSLLTGPFYLATWAKSKLHSDVR